jgi:predicted 3-demethylubiquinone-9 3-methyltransferase (glyoxalase superfamily)
MGGKIAKIQTYLWFDNQAEEAVRFYTSFLKNSGIGNITYHPSSGEEFPGRPPTGSVMTVEFHLEGQEFVALNGGPAFKLSEAVSIAVNCETQEEVDYYWEKFISNGGEESHCGWLKDKFGLSWQIVPAEFYVLAFDPDSKKSNRVLDIMYTMKKLDLDVLRKAYEGK